MPSERVFAGRGKASKRCATWRHGVDWADVGEAYAHYVQMQKNTSVYDTKRSIAAILATRGTCTSGLFLGEPRTWSASSSRRYWALTKCY